MVITMFVCVHFIFSVFLLHSTLAFLLVQLKQFIISYHQPKTQLFIKTMALPLIAIYAVCIGVAVFFYTLALVTTRKFKETKTISSK